MSVDVKMSKGNINASPIIVTNESDTKQPLKLVQQWNSKWNVI